MKTIKTEDAVGTILCHDLTRIVRNEVKETAFRKGHVVRPEDIPVLLAIGKTRLFVWDLGEDMVHENDAVAALRGYCQLEGPFAATPPKEGGLHLTADGDGLFLADLALLEAVNDDGELAVVVRPSGVMVKRGEKVASFKVIPLAVAREKLERARALLAGKTLFAIKPFMPMKAAIVATGSEVFTGRIKDTFTPVVEEKLAEYGIGVIKKTVCDDRIGDIASAVRESLAMGADLIVCTGGMSVDPDDLTPGAIKASGAEIVAYGAPVMPGAMFLVAYIGDVPVLGLPGCVMFGKRTIFDVIMPRIAVGRRVTGKEIRQMGHGGLCLACPRCVFPVCGFGRGSPYGL
ncbi:MAG: molybdopterin-binding protein [Deltaproteobacteria bacterium]|jgi:molybdenum cofactor synthesis domain-containing protein|nr:molybdopterin-binding protein [Deltaproteobacteria bacterium]